MKEVIVAIGAILCLALLTSTVLSKRVECQERGGALVRGVMGFSCVAGVNNE